MRDRSSISVATSTLEGLVRIVRERHPRKTFGYLLGEHAFGDVIDFVVFESNVRNEPEWRGDFEAYGRYFVEHDDAGFVASPEEAWRIQKELWTRGLREVGVFHSHRRHPANFSKIDYDLHVSRFDGLFHVIVSMRNEALPQVRAFGVDREGVWERRIEARTEVTTGAHEGTTWLSVP